MKSVVQINVVCNGSTGKIMCDISRELEKKNYKSYIFFGRGEKNRDLNCFKIGNKFTTYFHVILARLGFNGHGSFFATKKLVRRLKKINPTIIHLHNIHGYYINLKVLFNYLKNYDGKIIWTLHDCWSFTGHCAYFTLSKCNKWTKCCMKCPNLKTYPSELFDTTRREFNLKKKLFLGLDNLTIITPSNWLKGLVKKSFLKDYDVRVVNNGINLDVFKPCFDDSIYDKYNISKSKKIILGVANIWEERKGLDIFLSLSKLISFDEVIVLVGLSDEQINNLPDNIVGIKRTDNQNDLACLYSMATVFMNPSREETFSLVTVEAMACGTPVIVCGKSAPRELVVDKVGFVVNDEKPETYYAFYKKIVNNKIDSDRILDYAKKYDNQNMINKIINVYK